MKVVNGPDEIFDTAKQILDMQLITHQTGPEGKEVKRLLVEEAMEIQKEYYFGIVIDRASNCPVIMASIRLISTSSLLYKFNN